MASELVLAALVATLLACAPLAQAWHKCYSYGGVCGDPALVGGDGVQFYFHGHKDADFCLVSDRDLHINAHFIGRRNQGMRRDFTWVQSLGVLFGAHQLYIGANKVSSWDPAADHFTLALDTTRVALPTTPGASWSSGAVTITRPPGHAANFVAVEVAGQLSLEARVVPVSAQDNAQHGYGVTSDDAFAHLELNLQFPGGLSPAVAGVLGQTYRPGFAHADGIKPGQSMRTMRGAHRYRASALMAADCAVSVFGEGAGAAGAQQQDVLQNLPKVSCAGGAAGLVCRR